MENPSSNKNKENSGDFKRLTAYKISINNLLSYEYVKDEGWNPNYIIGPKEKISRVNIIGFITSKEDNNIIIDDSTSNITVRAFENLNIFTDKNVGDLVVVIGKPREFGNERYIVPDIIKKIEDALWLKVRHKELNIDISKIPKPQIKETYQKEEIIKKTNTEIIETKEEIKPTTENNSEKEKSSFEIIINLIEKKDSGEGVGVDEIILESGLENCEKIINTLLEEGEIFEIRPGIVKVL